MRRKKITMIEWRRVSNGEYHTTIGDFEVIVWYNGGCGWQFTILNYGGYGDPYNSLIYASKESAQMDAERQAKMMMKKGLVF